MTGDINNTLAKVNLIDNTLAKVNTINNTPAEVNPLSDPDALLDNKTFRQTRHVGPIFNKYKNINTNINISDEYKPKRIIKQKLFPSIKNNDIWEKIMIDDESVSYISVPDDAIKISKIIKQHCVMLNLDPDNLTVTDATAGVGGDVISFANTFMLVNAIEKDSKRYDCLVNNIGVYKLKNVLTYCGDSLDIIYNLSQQDIVFFDPPWGGKNYKTEHSIQLMLSDTYIEDICINLFDENITMTTPYIICLKLPKNYDLKQLYEKISNNIKSAKIYLYNLNKMFIVIIHTTNKSN